MSCIRSEPRITPAKNGLVLSWCEHEESADVYEGRKWLGEKQMIFKFSEANKCIAEFIVIAKECGHSEE